MTEKKKKRPGLLARIWGAISKPFQRKQRTAAKLTEYWDTKYPKYAETDFVQLVQHGFRRNELIFACVARTYGTAAQVRLRVRNKEDKEPQDNHDLALLLENPNSTMNGFDLLAAIIIFQYFGGRAAFEVQWTYGGKPYALWPLRPDMLRVKASAETPIAHYLFGKPGTTPKIIEPESVLDFKLFDPLNLWHGWPPVAVCSRTGDVDNAITDYYKLLMEHGGVPPGLLKTTVSLDEDEIEDLQERWRERYQGYTTWQAPAVIHSDAEYQKTGFSVAEMGLDVLDSRDEARICMTLQVPPILVGAKVGLERSTFANYAEARKSWWEERLIPMYADLLSGFSQQLLPLYEDDTIELYWDFTHVPALQEKEDAKWGRADKGLRSGWLTVNEAREYVGFEGLDEPGEVFLRGFGTVEVPMEGVRPLGKIRFPQIKEGELDSDETRLEMEKEITAGTAKFFDEQQERVNAALKQWYAQNPST